jgi:hypothetical protein
MPTIPERHGPTARQLEAFLLRCITELPYKAIGARLGIGEKTALLLAHGAAGRLIVGPATPDNEMHRELAFQHFPRIAAKHGKTQ